MWENDDTVKFFEEHGSALEHRSDGNTMIINFFGINLWNSDDDPRESAEDRCEPLVDYIRNQIIEKVSIISKIKV